MISNLASNFINTNNFTPHENNLLPWIFPPNDMQATLPPLPPQKVLETLKIKNSNFQLHQKSYGLRNLKILNLFYY